MGGIGQTWLNSLQCSGNESRLIDCDADALGIHNCAHSEDAGVLCSASTCTQGAIRLQGGTTTQGRVEICNNNIWGTVCDDNWKEADAQVACRQLGFSITGDRNHGHSPLYLHQKTVEPLKKRTHWDQHCREVVSSSRNTSIIVI